MERIRVVITGIGIVSPLGLDLESTWSALLRGESGIDKITLFDPSGLRAKIAAEVKGFDPGEIFGRRDARRMDRYTQFAMYAAGQAMEDSGLKVDDDLSPRMGVVLGSGVGGIGTTLTEAKTLYSSGARRVSPHLIPMMLIDTAPGKIAIEFGARGPNMNIATACASANNAIGEAAEMIRRGIVDVMVTGGSEAGVVEISLAGFDNMKALSRRNDDPKAASRPFDKDRDGFVAGEGAGIIILESEEHALARGATIYAELLGYGSSADAYHITAPPENGRGAIQAMQSALTDAGVETEDIDYLNAHGTSTPINDRAETAAVKTLFGEGAYDLTISSTKSMTGHPLGAGGALEAIFCLKAIETGDIPPTINYQTPDPDCDLNYTPNESVNKDVNVAMSNSFGFGGHNACLIIGKYANGAG